jgi:hypothetical protein
MKTMLFKKTILVALIAALTLAAIPASSVFAAGIYAPPTLPAQGQGLSTERLERIWDRMNSRYERLGKFFDKSDGLVGKAEKMVARLKGNSESTAELEAALAAYQEAVRKAHPIYETCKSILNSHKGFDAKGKVTDAGQARETLKDFGAKLGEIHTAMDGKAKELIELMKSIRDAHKPASSGGA